METPSGDKELDALAVNCKQLSKKRKRAQDAEVEGFDLLEAKLREKKISRYVNEEAGLEVLITITEKVKVNEIEEVKAEPAADDGEPEPEEAEEGAQRAAKKRPAAEA